MRVIITVLAFALLSITAPGCGSGESGTEAANACSGVMCPPGTTHDQTASASSSCSGGGSVSVDLVDQSGSVTGQCFGSGECAIVCHPPAPCCGGEKWTTISYECATPCAGACDCTDRCGPIAGTDCEVDCGDCTGTDLCSPDGYCGAGCGESETQCGADCCDVGETCHQNLCCDRVENCKGKQCGDDGCGGLCEDQPSIVGCAGDELCIAGTCSASGCEDIPSQCASEGGEEFINGCDEETLEWGKITDCSSESGTPYCDTVAGGPACVACSQDGHCGNPENYACVDNACECTPACGDNECGDDGCGGSCGACEGATPNCLEKDGISGCYACVDDSDCGDPFFWTCDAGACSCTADCKGETCGADGCGGWCGTCDGDGGCDAVGEKACSTGTGLEESLSCALVGEELQWETSVTCVGDTPTCQSGACVCTSDADCSGASESCIEGACVYVAACGNGIVDSGELCFGVATKVGITDEPVGLSTGDLDGDDVNDLVVLTQSLSTKDLTTILGAGAGSFASPVVHELLPGFVRNVRVGTFATGSNVPLAVYITSGSAGYLDLYEWSSEPELPYYGGANVPNYSSSNPLALGAGDLNGDATTDLAWHDMPDSGTPKDMSLHVGLSEENAYQLDIPEVKQTTIPAAYKKVRAIAIGDLSGTGQHDLVVAVGTSNFTDSLECNSIPALTGYEEQLLVYRDFKLKPTGGAPSFVEDDALMKVKPIDDPDYWDALGYDCAGISGIMKEARIWDLHLSDVDGDGDLDPVAFAGGVVQVFQNQGANYSALWNSPYNVFDGDEFAGITKDGAVGDINGDGVVDLVAAVQPGVDLVPAGHIAVFLSNGATGSWTMEPLDFIASETTIRHVELTDLNGDGALDIVYTTRKTDGDWGFDGEVYVRLQNP